MAVTSSPRFGLVRWSAGTDEPSRQQFDDAHRLIDELAAQDLQVTAEGDRPAAATRGRYCYVTETGNLYRDTGAAWQGPVNLTVGHLRLDGGDLNRSVLRRAQLRDYSEVATAETSAATTYAISLAAAQVHRLRLTGSVALTISGAAPAGQASTVTLYVRQDATGGRGVTWPSSFQWPNGTPPVLASGPNALSIVSAMTVDGGSTWQAFLAGAGLA